MAASMLKWVPGTLYNNSLNVVVENYKNSLSELKVFPPSVQFDVLHKLYEYGCLVQLRGELCDLDVLARMLKVVDKRHLLHHCFQALMDQALSDHRTKISTLLSQAYVHRCSQVDIRDQQHIDSLVLQGLSVSTFLAEAGWLLDAENILTSCQDLLTDSTNPQQMTRALECCHRLLHVQNGYCRFEEAERTYNQAMQLVKRLQQAGVTPNLSSLYSEFSTLYMLRSNYAEAYSWSVKALYALVANFPRPALIDVLRQSAKACVLKREFKKAGLLIKQAVMIATEVFGDKHPKYADTLIDYGFYLLNVDAINQGVQVYQTALDVRQNVFGGINLHVAIAHEDLAYASYVHNYAFGKFDHARTHAERAIDLMLRLLPDDHLLLSSSKRVKALILEEMAIDNPNKDVEKKYLAEAHSLHKEALAMAMRAFGEMNVQTAKHYGNLGRLYQSMRHFQEAEEMHLKAILIKEQLLGPEDYEVALSVGHLASLYNYDMMKYDKAESLYLRSIAIGKKLFGEAYSGLEYDYRGLLRVYSIQANMEKCFKYQNILSYWKLLRDEAQETQTSPFTELNEPLRVLDTGSLICKVFKKLTLRDVKIAAAVDEVVGKLALLLEQ